MISKIVKPLYPAGVVITAPLFIPVVLAKEGGGCHECCKKKLPKAHELPLYDTSEEKLEFEIVQHPKSSLEEAISVTRKTATKYIGVLDGARKYAVEVYHTGVAHSKSTYDYITEENSVVPRTVAIASGGLAGLLLGIRGGKFKKIVYTSFGAGAVASACYPSQAKEYASKGYEIASEQTTKLLKEYTGYDLNNATSDIKEKLGNFSISEKVTNLNITEKLSNVAQSAKDYSAQLLSSKKLDKSPEGDLGQGNPADKDLYTTRTGK